VAKTFDLCDRTFNFAIRAMQVFDHLQSLENRAGWVIANQFLRAATSIGANIEEAQASESRADFKHKMNIAQKEARETHYWLRLLIAGKIVPENRLTPLLDEANQLIAILTTICRKTKS